MVTVTLLVIVMGCANDADEHANTPPSRDTSTPIPPATPLVDTSTPTLTPTQPSVPPTATPFPKKTSKIITAYRSRIEDEVTKRDSHCHLNEDFRATIRRWTSNSITYLRTYFEIPDLDATDVRSVVDYLEGERGRHERLCNLERGVELPEANGVMDIKRSLDERILDGTGDKSTPCEIESTLENLIYSLSTNDISYIRGVFDVGSLSPSDVLYLISHYESELGRYARLCALGR